MTINLQTGGYTAPQIVSGARSADIQVGQKQVQKDTVISAPATPQNVSPDAPSVEEKRYQQVIRAAQSSFAVSDKTFAIFKDATGQYITRFKSLRDGRVTYIPEQRLLQQFEASQRSGRSAISIQA